jgi:hypothetical protein
MPPPPAVFGFPGIDPLNRVPFVYSQPPPPAQKAKGPPQPKFTVQEDDQLRGLVAELGVNNWAEVAARLGTRSAR